MNNVLQDLSPSTIPLAMDANKIAYGTLLSTLPHAAFHEEPGICWFETGIPNDLFNGVLQTNVQPETLPAVIERILTHFQQRRLPFQWHIGPTSQPANFENLLPAYGIGHVEDEPGMAVDLLALNEDIPVPSNFGFHPVTTEQLLRQWTRVWGCGAPEGVIQDCFKVYSGLVFSPQSPLRMYLGTIAGEPVATVALFFGAGVASFEHVVTIPQVRRQGIGAAITLMAAREARAQGYHIGVLTSSPMGFNIYSRIGFREYCTFSAYEWSPEASS
ncbi:MAG: GNAT family N-acetyltransferase [Ktedonobacteraceae bacterium]